jgi:phosphonate transport system substrate-binding protein
MKYLNDHHIKPKETVFAMRHDNVVSMVYQGQVDAGATFYVAPFEGKIQDARMLVKAQYPDVEEKIKIIEFTDPIPNDPVVFRKDLPEDMKQKISDALIRYVKTDEGRQTLQRLSGVTGLVPTSDREYDKTREYLKSIAQPPSETKK